MWYLYQYKRVQYSFVDYLGYYARCIIRVFHTAAVGRALHTCTLICIDYKRCVLTARCHYAPARSMREVHTLVTALAELAQKRGSNNLQIIIRTPVLLPCSLQVLQQAMGSSHRTVISVRPADESQPT